MDQREAIKLIGQTPTVLECRETLFNILFSNPIVIEYQGIGFHYGSHDTIEEYTSFCKRYYSWKITRGVIPWYIVEDEFGFGHPVVPDTCDGDVAVLGLYGTSKYTFVPCYIIKTEVREYHFIECVEEHPTMTGELRCPLSRVIEAYTNYVQHQDLFYRVESRKAQPTVVIEKRVPTNTDLIADFKSQTSGYEYRQYGNVMNGEESLASIQKSAQSGLSDEYGAIRQRESISAMGNISSLSDPINAIRVGQFDTTSFVPVSNPSVNPSEAYEHLKSSICSVLGFSSHSERRSRDHRSTQTDHRVRPEYISSIRKEFEDVVKKVFLHCFDQAMRTVSEQTADNEEEAVFIYQLFRSVTVTINPINDRLTSIDLVNRIYCAQGLSGEDHADVLSRKVGLKISPMSRQSVAEWLLGNHKKNDQEPHHSDQEHHPEQSQRLDDSTPSPSSPEKDQVSHQ